MQKTHNFAVFVIDRNLLPGSLALMLAASERAPNPRIADASAGMRPPKPAGWPGAAESLRKAEAMIETGDFYGAEDVLREALDFAPMEGRAWHMLGRCQQAQQRHAAALESFARADACYRRQAACGAGGEAPASARLAELLWRQGEKDAASAMLEKLLAQAPDDEPLLALRRRFQAEPVSGATEGE